MHDSAANYLAAARQPFPVAAHLLCSAVIIHSDAKLNKISILVLINWVLAEHGCRCGSMCQAWPCKPQHTHSGIFTPLTLLSWWEKKSKCHHLLSVWTESDVTHMRTQSYSIELKAKQTIPLCTEHTGMCMHVYICINLCLNVCVCVCIWGGGVSNKELEKGLVVLWWAWGEFGFHCEIENHRLRKRVIGFPPQCIPANRSAYTRFFFSFFFSLKTTQMYSMKER